MPPVLLLRLISDGPLCTEIGLRVPLVSSRLATSSESLLGRSRAKGPGQGLPGPVGDGGQSVMSTASVDSLVGGWVTFGWVCSHSFTPPDGSPVPPDVFPSLSLSLLLDSFILSRSR